MQADDGHEELFGHVLHLEDQYYREGYHLGVADGSRSGRIEGRTFGLEKGFEKFVEMGKLHGKAVLWEARLPATISSDTPATANGTTNLPPLQAPSGNARLRKHVERLAALSDPNDLSTENNEDAVSDFDDRLKDAKAKATLISRMAGEHDSTTEASAPGQSGRETALRVRRTGGSDVANTPARPTGEMEDFVGLPR
ncbi:hypothetical protein CLAFUW4_13820 [Fulvia fulva]|uniref:Essential protein Yae1 N-terminal domain-containing protein n=1 Tax=Passalora fulva TaxID=5499 RepID=A0A9Q8PKQ0_PASFU|nr:uncharacterized protein CLAFUR5_13664 [Fulvia fulva]KAK4610266.1 hypothetical protein CLAFUR4_13822 [Fulvia fulva]KAK4610886.1 hypothetical protein CLAFUR0_13826 [Fulvia fulva]UJO24238.1 hypothetical protein CLAFUR5_13664 [Fulvia fulva]WPV21975.1 hypothetical protein CLAFUW4_13820 [Fulvia fulva]WPV37315.1 hypothetical protein CLAFUW7_13828 [Fulvia fulva]